MTVISNTHKKKISPESLFFIIIVLFGIFSTLLTFPLTNGDEGFHLSKSYSVFSSDNPESVNLSTLRNLELHAIGAQGSIESFDITDFRSHKLEDVKNDGISFNILEDKNLLSGIDIAHVIPAIGVLLARKIYPSYGVMLLGARLANLFFFAISFFGIIKFSKLGKWSLFMLFSVPLVQKIASPSYDVFSFIAFAAFSVNWLSLIKSTKLSELKTTKTIYTLFTILLLVFAKKNYLFSLLLLLIPLLNFISSNVYRIKSRRIKMLFFSLLVLLIIVILFTLNSIFNLSNFFKIFYDNYLNVATSGRRGKSLFTITPVILPNIINILWMILLFFVSITELPYSWRKTSSFSAILIFFTNWFGIYAAFYLSLGRPSNPFDQLSGRYLHPYYLMFLPLIQTISNNYTLSVPEKVLRRVVLSSTIIILTLYLLVVYYRGYALHISPTW